MSQNEESSAPSYLVSVEEALASILAEARPLASERVDLLSALGRICAEKILARRALPPFDNSAMDGYAVRAAEGVQKRRVVGVIACGDPPGQLRLGEGEAARIFTGAPVPPGADAVIMQEEASALGDTVAFTHPPKEGQHIRRGGTDIGEGEALLLPGEEIGPAEISALAAQGRSFVAVYRRPCVAILSTGSELVEIDQEPGAGLLVNSNAYALCAMVREAGAEATMLGIAPDEQGATEAMLARALFADVIVTSGGVSVGELDYVRAALDALGYEPRFWKIAMKPGKPVVFGVLKGRPVLGLPGNPASCHVSFELFVRPLLRAMSGDPTPSRPRRKARLSAPLRAGERRHFVRATLSLDKNGDLCARPLQKQGSGELRSLLGANCLLDIPPKTPLREGDLVDAIVYRRPFL